MVKSEEKRMMKMEPIFVRRERSKKEQSVRRIRNRGLLRFAGLTLRPVTLASEGAQDASSSALLTNCCNMASLDFLFL